MNTHSKKPHENKNQSVAGSYSQKQAGDGSAIQFADNRQETIRQRKLQAITNNSDQVQHGAQLQAMSDSYSSRQDHPVRKKENKTNLPDQLKSGIENLSGYSLDDVKVHYNSNKPSQLQAHAYAQGTAVYLAPGQERHLAHEAWHVVQQKQGRVKATSQMAGGVNVNGEAHLEKEADVMGKKALQMQINSRENKSAPQYVYGPAKKNSSENLRTAQLQPVVQFVYPRVAQVYGESVYVNSEQERQRAYTIFRTINRRFGVTLDSDAGVVAIRNAYPLAPPAVLLGLSPAQWDLQLLEAVLESLERFAQLLGHQRPASTRGGAPQEITTMSRVNYDIPFNGPAAAAGTAYGEYFAADSNVSIFDESMTATDAFPTVAEEMRGTVTHEAVHGLLAHELPGYVAHLAFWTDANTASGVAGAEAPPTAYGATNASEDFSESVMLYFMDRARLQNGTTDMMGVVPAAGNPGNPCPVRDAYIHTMVTTRF